MNVNTCVLLLAFKGSLVRKATLEVAGAAFGLPRPEKATLAGCTKRRPGYPIFPAWRAHLYAAASAATGRSAAYAYAGTPRSDR
jgi:hypothetical protein